MKSRAISLALLSVALTAGCVGEEDRCPSPTDEYASVIRWAWFVGPQEAPQVVIGGYRSVECWDLDDSSLLGSRRCASRAVDEGPFSPIGLEPKLGVVERPHGVTVVTSRHTITVEGQGAPGQVAALQAPAGVDAGSFVLRAVFPGPATTRVAWAARAPHGADTLVGLGRLEGQQVIAVGEPFYRASQTAPEGVPVVGGRDPETDHLYVQSPPDDQVFEFDATLSLVSVAAHGEPVNSEVQGTPTRWTWLPDGRWAGLIGQWLCTFQPTDRATQRCFRLFWGPEVPEGYTIPYDLRVDAQGDLLIAAHQSPNDPLVTTGLVIARWKLAGSPSASFTPHRIPECDILLSIR